MIQHEGQVPDRRPLAALDVAQQQVVILTAFQAAPQSAQFHQAAHGDTPVRWLT